jgi:hypothetical protein
MSQWGITPRWRLRSMSIWLSNVNGCTWNILESHLNPISGNHSMCSLFPSENTVNECFHGMTHPLKMTLIRWLKHQLYTSQLDWWFGFWSVIHQADLYFQGIPGTKFPTNQPLRVYQTDDKLVHSEPSLVFWGQAMKISPFCSWNSDVCWGHGIQDT